VETIRDGLHTAHINVPAGLQEKDFEVYEPYCANYMNALELVEKETPNLQVSHVLRALSEMASDETLCVQSARYPTVDGGRIERLSYHTYPADMPVPDLA